jgi:hypothetical protein
MQFSQSVECVGVLKHAAHSDVRSVYAKLLSGTQYARTSTLGGIIQPQLQVTHNVAVVVKVAANLYTACPAQFPNTRTKVGDVIEFEHIPNDSNLERINVRGHGGRKC